VWEVTLELLGDLQELDHGRKYNEVEQHQNTSQDAYIDERHSDNPGEKALEETDQWMDAIGNEHGDQQKRQGTADLAEPPEDHPTHRQPHQESQADDEPPLPKMHVHSLLSREYWQRRCGILSHGSSLPLHLAVIS